MLATALLFLGAVSARARPAGVAVHFHGYRLSVPASWPVFDLTRAPSTCVRFNRHAIYLGVPGANQRCPAHAIGRVSAILVAPLSAVTSGAAGGGGTILRGAPSEGSATSYAVPRSGVEVTATWSGGGRLIARILKRRLRATARPRRPGARAASVAAGRRRSGPPARATSAAATFTGLGFDACSAPSATAMSDWSASPFRGVGVYIGGVNAACSQPNLTPAWVRAQVAAGWHLIPTYVGLQGAGSCSGTCATITPSQARSEGTTAAGDAVTQAQALGIPAGNPIYDDMEQYSSSSTNTTAVLAFLSGWTSQLHADGYLSGVYGSGSSVITDLVNGWGTSYTEPDDIWIASWNGRQTTSDAYVPSSEWSNQQRLHQYEGAHNDTYGGATINIDSDYLNGATAGTASPIPDGTFVELRGQPAVYRIAGGAPLYVSSWSQFGGPQRFQSLSTQQFAQLRPYPLDGTFLTTTSGNVYRVAGGAPFAVTNWSLFGGPQTSVTVDQWDVSNVANPLSHLCPAPENGTLVEGLPSGSYWSFTAGIRSSAGTSALAVTVDDNGLAAYPLAPAAARASCPQPPKTHVARATCAVPRLKHLSLTRARRALTQARCRVGRIRRPKHWRRHHLLRVFGQSAAPRSLHPAQYRVDLRLL